MGTGHWPIWEVASPYHRKADQTVVSIYTKCNMMRHRLRCYGLARLAHTCRNPICMAQQKAGGVHEQTLPVMGAFYVIYDSGGHYRSSYDGYIRPYDSARWRLTLKLPFDCMNEACAVGRHPLSLGRRQQWPTGSLPGLSAGVLAVSMQWPYHCSLEWRTP